ncbi:nucleotide exchange factor GrpE [Puniceicoccaceae bacterium K14]|nr:nucleotide exchange factor GrpE [Puniceicoccaceae bacterium K14]
MNNAMDKENTDADPEDVVEESAVEEQTEAAAEESQVDEESVEVEKELTLEEQLEEAKAKAEDNYSSYLRAMADLDTYKRRVMREKDELKQYATAGILESFLPVYDNMGFGLVSAEQNADPKVVLEGIKMVLTQFKSLLGEHGVTEIAPAPGDEFDHNLHEAFQTKPSDEIEEGKVLQMIRKGFSLNGRLVRPANIIVSGGKAEETE